MSKLNCIAMDTHGKTTDICCKKSVKDAGRRWHVATTIPALREVIETRGLFCSLYSDRASHFFVTPKAGEAVDKDRLTQVGRALKELSITMIPAYSPQARGRSERSFGTWQGRLPQELRLAGITARSSGNPTWPNRSTSASNLASAHPASSSRKKTVTVASIRARPKQKPRKRMRTIAITSTSTNTLARVAPASVRALKTHLRDHGINKDYNPVGYTVDTFSQDFTIVGEYSTGPGY